MSFRFARSSRRTHVRPDDIPACPPPEVLDAIARAHEACERLEASGRRVHLDLNEASGVLTLELTDASGTPLRSLSPRAVLELAAGASPQ
ncbi:MAG: hypothetical protein WAU75_00930 [Solirubrobacteraceae bacterium]